MIDPAVAVHATTTGRNAMDVDAMGSSDASVARLSSGRWARRETGLITKKETRATGI